MPSLELLAGDKAVQPRQSKKAAKAAMTLTTFSQKAVRLVAATFCPSGCDGFRAMKITAEILGRGAEGVWWGKRARQDLNLRPLAPEASALS